MAGERVDLWEAYSLARSDGPALTAEADRIAEGHGGTGALREKLEAVRGGTGPLVAFLRQLLPTVLPQPAEAQSLDLSLVFIMTSPQARAKALRWQLNPAQSQAEATVFLRVMGRMVESYRRALIDSRSDPPPPDRPAAAVTEPDDLERRIQAKLEAERKARTDRIMRVMDEVERSAGAKEGAGAEETAKKQAEAERVEREKAEAERAAREKAEAIRIAREKADALLSPDQREARDQARAALREKLPDLLADPWREEKVGSWFRVKAVVGGQTTYTDMGLRERGAGFTVLAVQSCAGGRPEWEKWERSERRSVKNLGQEPLDVGGSILECDVYQVLSQAGEEELWIALDAPHAGATLKSGSPGRAFVARKVGVERVSLETREIECVRAEGDESAGGKTAQASYWWSLSYPLGPVRALTAGGSTEAIRAGDNWNNRPPFPA
jgi:hypothetical protein